MITVDKFFCLLDLKWGMLVIGIVDIVLGVCGACLLNVKYVELGTVILAIVILHFIACILLIISAFVPKKPLVICYLITGILRILIMIVAIIISAICGSNHILSYIIEVLIIIIGIYFWICAYSYNDQI